MLAVTHGIGKKIIQMDLLSKGEKFMSEAVKFFVKTKKGDVLYGRHWKLEPAMANVIIMPGMEEHSGRYDEFAKYLNAEGFNVYCLDPYGQGLNVMPDMCNLGVWPKSGFRKQIQAVDRLVKDIRISCRPTFIFAHSMGSFMAQDFMQRYTHHVSKVVLCGSGAKNPLVSIAYPLARLVTWVRGRNRKAGLLNTLMFGGFKKTVPNRRTDYDWLSYDEENVDRYIADPLCGFGPNNGFCLEFLKGMNRLYKRKFLEKIRKDLDILIISGQDDVVSNNAKDVEKLEKMYHKYKLSNVQTKVYEGMRHEILNETNREIVYKDVVAFFKHELEKKNVV